MTHATKLSVIIGVSLAATLFAGCFGPRADETQFFILTSEAAPESGAGGDITVGLGPITFPAYLNRPQVVTRLGPNQVDVSNHDRWAESLDGNFARSLAENLAALASADNIVHYPWYSTTELDHVVQVDVIRFEFDSLGAADLLCRWTLFDGKGTTRLAGREAQFTSQATAPNTASSVAALSGALADLSREIATALRRAGSS